MSKTNKRNLWRELIEFLNEQFKCGKSVLVTRKEIMKHFGLDPKLEQTVDSYRRYLTRLGHLSEYGRGCYSIESRIMSNLSLSAAKEMAYSKVSRGEKE